MSRITHESRKEAAERLIKQVLDVPVMPQCIFKIAEARTDTHEANLVIEKSVGVDPGFALKVMRLANSLSPEPITSVRRAVQFLGRAQIVTLASNSGNFDGFLGKTDAQSMRRRSWWRKSLDAAVCGRYLARRFPKKLDPDEVYTMCLFHQLGRMLLDRVNSFVYAKVEEKVAGGMSVEDAEYEVFGCDHVDIAQAMILSWGLPEVVAEGVNYLRSQEGTNPCNGAMVSLAGTMSAAAISGMSRAEQARQYDRYPGWALETLDIDDMKLQILVLEGEAAIASSAHLAAA